jgi:hypothetical protein
MLVAIMVEHFIQVESNPLRFRVVHECRYRTSGSLLTVWSYEEASCDCIAAIVSMVLAISAPFNRLV